MTVEVLEFVTKSVVVRERSLLSVSNSVQAILGKEDHSLGERMADQ